MEKPNKELVIRTGIVGMFAAALVGLGECFLHFDPNPDHLVDDGTYLFIREIPRWRLTWGHFLAVLGTPFYLVGMYHLYLGLKPFGERTPGFRYLPLLVFLVACFGFMMGTVWIGSRVSIALLVQAQVAAGGDDATLAALIQAYIDHYESLLAIIRFTTLFTSIAYVVMILFNRTLYPRWMAIFSPIVLLVLQFVLLITVPAIGIFTAPIALNVGYFIFFALSTSVLATVCNPT